MRSAAQIRRISRSVGISRKSTKGPTATLDSHEWSERVSDVQRAFTSANRSAIVSIGLDAVMSRRSRCAAYR